MIKTPLKIFLSIIYKFSITANLAMENLSRINKKIRSLVRWMARANPLWGAPRIHGELLKLGMEISERTVSNLMPARPPKPPSQTWRAFMKNHMHMKEVVTAPQSPWQNSYVERLIGSIRRDFLDHVIVLNQ